MTELVPENLWNDYCQTRVLFNLNSLQYRLLPSESGDNTWPWSNDITNVFILSATHPRSKQSTDDEIVRLNQHMAISLDELSLNYMMCIGKPARDDWPEEESFLITNATESTIIKLCQDFDQNAYFHWTKDFWSVKGIFAPQTYFTNWILEN
jgi:hypothetical protein